MPNSIPETAEAATAASDIPAQATAALNGARAASGARLDEILAKAESLFPITLSEAASLLMMEDEGDLGKLFLAAGRVKEMIYGPRVVLFAPLYLSNYCSNDCLYCGFRRSNAAAKRRALSAEEAVGQAKALSATGFKRLLLVAGESAGRSGVEYLTEVARAIYAGTDMRILHVNCAPLSVDGFRKLKAAGFGVYQCFQETYHEETYRMVHPSGKKKDFQFRLSAMDRALEAGFGDVGIGALLGLYDYRFEALAVIAHSRRLEARFGAAAHTISVPRLRPAEGAELIAPPYPVSDIEFKKVVAVYRLSVPWAGVVISTREPAALRDEVLNIGASQISAGSSTEPGGYGEDEKSASQFEVDDHRGLDEMVRAIALRGLMPSLCTACYRSGRQGEEFRELAGTGGIKDFCTPNAALSLKEYALDAASEETRVLCEDAIAKALAGVEEPLKRDLIAKLERTAKGERDLHY